MQHVRSGFFLLGVCLLSVGASAAPKSAAYQILPSEAVTVRDFIDSCDRNVSLCEYKMRMAALNNINTRDAVPVCLKNSEPRNEVMNWLKAHPETHGMATEDGLYKAYMTLYPCP